MALSSLPPFNIRYFCALLSVEFVLYVFRQFGSSVNGNNIVVCQCSVHYMKGLIDCKLRSKLPCCTSCFVNKTSEAWSGHGNFCLQGNLAKNVARFQKT